jgi:hypothetical protein
VHEFDMHFGGESGDSSVLMPGWSASLSGAFKKERQFWYLFDFSGLQCTTSYASLSGFTLSVHQVC